jgi:hypothetical protein
VARRRGISSSIPALLIIIVGIIVVITIWRNKNFLNFSSAAPALAAGQIYPGADPVHECNNVSDGDYESGNKRREPQMACGFNFLNVEAAVYINTHGISDTLSVELRGPKHSSPTPDDDMCNNIHDVSLGGASKQAFGKQSGYTAEYCEFGPAAHALPDDTWVGVKAIEWNDGTGVHFQTWIENPAGSGFKLVADEIDNGNTGCGSDDPRADPPYTTSPCQDVGQPVSIGFRIDGVSPGTNDVQFGSLSVREIAIPAEPLTTTTAVGPATPSVYTPPDGGAEPATEEEEEEDEDEEEDDEEEDSGGDDEDNGGDGDSPGTRSQDPTTQRINSCSGLTGETYRSCVNGAAAVSPRRRGNLASRRPITRAMLSAYSPNYFKLRKKIRVGNIR